MVRTLELAVAVVLMVAGAVLALGFPDLEFWWFRGRPLGVVLLIVGALDLVTLPERRARA